MGLRTEDAISRGRLFRWTWILADILEPYPDVRIVVHSSWRLLQPEAQIQTLLGPLCSRYAGVIPPPDERWEGIASYVIRNKLADYRILDDHPELFPAKLPQLIACDSESGLYDQDVRRQLRMWLAGPKAEEPVVQRRNRK